MLESLMWGAVAAIPLLIGAVLAVIRRWPTRLVGIVLGFGAGALIASIAFELWEEGYRSAGPVPLVTGLVLGALAYYFADRLVERIGKKAKSGSGGMPLALGALLDGIPEQLVLGIGLAAGEGVSVALVVAIFVSNLPESIGSSADLLDAGWSRARVIGLWSAVTVVCTLATVAGFMAGDFAAGAVGAGASGFAAGALLVMLADSMMPEAQEKAKNVTGLATVVGFAVAAGLSIAG